LGSEKSACTAVGLRARAARPASQQDCAQSLQPITSAASSLSLLLVLPVRSIQMYNYKYFDNVIYFLKQSKMK
jgi:hypothetical protein